MRRFLVLIIILAFTFSLQAQTSKSKTQLASLIPQQAATLIENVLKTEGHPCRVEAKQPRYVAPWDFRINLERTYTEDGMLKLLGAIIGAVSEVTRHTSWRSDKVFIRYLGLDLAYITTKGCRRIMKIIEEEGGARGIEELQKEMVLLVRVPQ